MGRKIKRDSEDPENKRIMLEKRREYNRKAYKKRQDKKLEKNFNVLNIESSVLTIVHDHNYYISRTNESTLNPNLSSDIDNASHPCASSFYDNNSILLPFQQIHSDSSENNSTNNNIDQIAAICGSDNTNESLHLRHDGTNSNRLVVSEHSYQVNRNNLVQSVNTIYDENYLGEINILCFCCRAKHFLGERVANKFHINSFNDCCNHGKVESENNETFPEELKLLFNFKHELSGQFLKKIRLYNNLFSFASFNANIIDFNDRRPGPYCFKIQGQVYYQINTALHPGDNEKPL